MKVLLRSRCGSIEALGELPKMPQHGNRITLEEENIVENIRGNPDDWVGLELTVHFAGSEDYTARDEHTSRELTVLELSAEKGVLAFA